jgi:superfamily II RNA helicase
MSFIGRVVVCAGLAGGVGLSAVADEREWKPERNQATERVRFKQKMLDSLEISEHQREQVEQLQQSFSTEMSELMKASSVGRKELDQLLEKQVANEELEKNITELTQLKAKQLRLIIRNRKQMERILGKAKADEFMQIARKKYEESRGRMRAGPRPEKADE